MLSMWFKKNILHQFWRTLIFLIVANPTKIRPHQHSRCYNQITPLPLMQRYNLYGYVTYVCYAVQKKYPPPVLANSYFPIDVSTYIRKVFDQNPSSSIFLMLQLNHTSNAFVGLDLCGYVFYVNYVVQKKYPPPVLANPNFLDWRQSDQNPSSFIFLMLHLNHTSTAFVEV